MERFRAHNLAEKLVRKCGGKSVFEVDTKKARFFDIPWAQLGSFGKRKFENLVFMQHMKENPKITYA